MADTLDLGSSGWKLVRFGFHLLYQRVFESLPAVAGVLFLVEVL